MMYINQNSFALNELIMSSGGIQNSQSFNLLQPSTTTNYTTHQKSNTLYQQTTAQAPPPQVTTSAASSTNATNLQQQQQQQQNNRSTSVSSTGSTSSSTSSSSTTASTPSTSPASTSSQFNKLAANNPIYPLNFAYYNPTSLAATSFNASSANQQKPFVSNSQLLANTTHLTSSVLTSPTNLSATSSATFNSLNEKFMYRPKSDNGILSNLNSYQLNVLTQKNPNQYQFNTTPTPASIVNNDSSLNSANLFLFNTTKNAQQNNQNYYNYEPTLAYLPTSTDLFFTASPSVDQFSTTSYLASPYLATAPPITQPTLNTKPLIPTFNTKTPFTATSIGINIKKKKRRFKKPIELRKVLPKNSLMLLHEYRPNVEYRFVCQSGPIHRPIFTMCVEINEHKFEGEGKTKKEARMSAAEKAIEFLMNNPEYIQKSSHSSSAASAHAPSQASNSVKQDSSTSDFTTKSSELSEEDEDDQNENENEDVDDHQQDNLVDEDESDMSGEPNVKRSKIVDSNVNEVTN